MDTRNKIIDLRARRPALVTGYFDPLTAAHVRRLREIRDAHDPVVVLLSDPAEPVLDARARAELLAALDMVDYVVLPQERASSALLERTGNWSVFHEEGSDEARFRSLVEHVHRRHNLPVSS